MPTKRMFVDAVCINKALIVAGGWEENDQLLTTVEILNTKDHQRFAAVDLPEPLNHDSITICGDEIYILGGLNGNVSTRSVYTCTVNALLTQNIGSGGIWSTIADLPVTLDSVHLCDLMWTAPSSWWERF